MARVLVVDDDEAFLYVVKRKLESQGHEVIPFQDWLGVLELLESDARVDVLLTDLRLPAGTPNGHSLGKMARARRPDLHVVYMTAYADLARTVRAAALFEVVMKTHDFSDVIAAVEHVLAA